MSAEPVTTFFAAWGEPDDATRRAMIDQSYATNGTYADPRSQATLTGPAAIADYVAMFSANAPGWRAEVVKTDTTENTHRVTVAFGGKGPDGNEMIQHGQYFVTLTNDKITTMVGFAGTGAPA